MKLYLDDVRPTPAGWERVYTAQECIERLSKGDVTELDLDHDLGQESVVGSGYDVLEWLEEQVFTKGFRPPWLILVHSSNASAKAKMLQAVESIQRYYLTKSEE